jgi:hypothetical protein
MTKFKGISEKGEMTKEERENAVKYFKEASHDAILYWVNSTYQLLGVNATMATLLNTLGTCIVKLIPVDQADQVEDTVMELIRDSFDELRKGRTLLREVKADKDDMN